ncbi:MAG TPA: TaqI-like C-terminal specificity domain-containing protein [Methanothrix sp.]|nr:TaqI-like C-terminal specificity domain-containing protein [Methanothrix sp.]
MGNPPYVRQERLGEDKHYFQNTFKAYHGIADLYVYFFERGHDVLRNGGEFGFISSNKFMRSNYGMPLRRYLLNGIRIKQIIDFGELPIFREASTFPAIFLTEKTVKDGSVRYVPIASLDFVSLEEIVAQCGLDLDLNAFDSDSWALCADSENNIMRKMAVLGLTLGEYTSNKIYWGIKTGLNEAFIIDIGTRKKLILEDPKNENIIKPILTGDDIRKYKNNYKNSYLIYIPWHFPLHEDTSINCASENAEEAFRTQYSSIYAHLLKFKDRLLKRNAAETGIRYEWYALQRFASEHFSEFAKPKIIYPEIAKESRFSADFDGEYVLNNKCFFIPIKDHFLLSILNSKLTFFYILRICSVLGDRAKKGRAELRSIHLTRLPIRCISFSTPAPERARLGAELEQLYADCKHEEILAQVEACLPKDAQDNFIADQEKSDVVHDLLAFLAERMLEMNKQKQQEIRGFLGWLEGYVGAKVEDLTPKTKLQSYYEHDYESFLAVLKKNRKKLQIDPARREPAEALRAEFEESMGKLGPLRERIRQTDELIDAVVYKLYGLTEEEIAIVEGKEVAK